MDVNRILLDILVVLLAAKAAAELADRVRVPAVVGEIVAGVVIGPSVLGWVHTSEALQTLAQLGVILLLLEVGLEMDLQELGGVGRAALSVALVGVVVPLVGGSIAGLGLGMEAKEALFVGAALTATSVGITARVFSDLRALASVEAKTVLGAAVADDILGLVILTVVTRIVTQGSVSALGIVWVVVAAVGFVVLTSLVGVKLVPPAFALVRRHSRSAGTLVAIALAFTLAVAELAHAAKLAPIVGAFVAGIALARSSAADRVRSELSPVAHLLVPVFFLEIGIDAQVDQFGPRPAVLRIAAVLLLVGVVGKLCAVVGLFGAPGDRLLVGLGMIPRGEVGLIFATLGLNQHIFGADVYAALLLVVLATTVGTPPFLRWRLQALRSRQRGERPAGSSAGVGLLQVSTSGTVELATEPVPSDALAVALRAARLCGDYPPGPSLVDWLGEFPPGPRRWDDNARVEFFHLLREGTPRSWRLLTESGVLQRCLPELDDLLARRRSSFEVDPLAALRFEHLSELRDLVDEGWDASVTRATLVAGLVLDACDGDTQAGVVVSRRSVQRLDLGARTEQLAAALIADSALLKAAARRTDAFSEEAVLQLAVHLGSAEQADALYSLTHAATLEGADLDRVGTLHKLVQQAFAHPEIVGRDAANEVERRRNEAQRLAVDQAVRQRIAAAPRAFVLSVSPRELARQSALCEPPPDRYEVRVALASGFDGLRVDVVARDRIGLLALATRALFTNNCSVTGAVATTWGDGVALSTYVVDAEIEPDPRSLRVMVEAEFDQPLASMAIAGIELDFDDAGSPWYTRCTVSGEDRPGLLHSLTTAFAMAGVSVHSAQIATDSDRVSDVFDLTDRRGAKLDDTTKARVTETIQRGAAPRRRGSRLRRHRRAGR